MARGGIYDQLGGGFHRYSTDPYWLVPHFEKMLYDNALLARLYLHAYQATGNPLYKDIAQETLDYALREMTHADGGFYSSQDADSEGEEGKFFVWTPYEMERVLGQGDAAILQAYFGVTYEGNFEGQNILHTPRSAAEVAKEQRHIGRGAGGGRRAGQGAAAGGQGQSHPARHGRQDAHVVERPDAPRNGPGRGGPGP